MIPVNDPVVAIVEDDPMLVDLYTEWASRVGEVRTTTSGDQALDVIDGDVDVVLLDRRLNDTHGDEVLTALRKRGNTAQVAMLTAVDADFDILDLQFDDYLHKPVSRTEFKETIEQLLRRSHYEDTVRKFHELAAKRAALETAKPPDELQQSDEYQQLLDNLDRARAAADDYLDQFDSDDYRDAFKRLSATSA